MNKRKKQIIAGIVFVVFLGCVGLILYSIFHQPEPEPEEPVVEEPVEIVIEEERERLMPIDFEYLRGINEDIYAFISVLGTKIGYPVLQHPTDNAYYLDHTMHHVAGLPGSIYTENRNAKDFSDFNTLIYGHNMKNGTMFKGLHQFRDQEFFDLHDTIMIYTEDQILTYKIFAAVIYDDRHVLATYDNESVDDRQAFIQSLYDVGSSQLFREDMIIDENSKLITLSTCTGNSSTRLLIIAKQVKAE